MDTKWGQQEGEWIHTCKKTSSGTEAPEYKQCAALSESSGESCEAK